MLTESKTIGKRAGAGWGKWLAVTLMLGFIAFLTGPSAPLGHFWGVHGESPSPTSIQILLLLVLSAIQSLALGLGVAYLIFGWSHIKSGLPAHRSLELATHLAISWSLISWWPHSNFHQSVGMGNLSSLLAIEYAFHVTLILSALIVAYFFVKRIRQL